MVIYREDRNPIPYILLKKEVEQPGIIALFFSFEQRLRTTAASFFSGSIGEPRTPDEVLNRVFMEKNWSENMMKNKSLKKMKRDIEAISPVIATILLVLVAVASAVAFYAFTSAWQSEQTDNLDNVDVNQKTEIEIAGSTTVYPLMEVAAAAFMDANPALTVSVSGGGSGAGITAAAEKTADIGMISKAWDGSVEELKHTVIAYDGVVIIIGDAAMTAHGITPAMLQNMNQTIIQGVYGIDDDGADPITTWGQLVDALNGAAAAPADSDPIVTYERAEESGTEEGFTEFIIGHKNIALDAEGVQGNPGMITAVRGDENGIGFTSYGMAAAEDSGLNAFWFEGVECTPDSVIEQIESKTGYAASRPLVILTNGVPNGIVADFIEFILDEENNLAFCDEVGYISLYA